MRLAIIYRRVYVVFFMLQAKLSNGRWQVIPLGGTIRMTCSHYKVTPFQLLNYIRQCKEKAVCNFFVLSKYRTFLTVSSLESGFLFESSRPQLRHNLKID